MFAYSDPTGTTILQETGALLSYRNLVDRFDTSQARIAGSAYTRRDAFDQLQGASAQTALASWKAYPQLAHALTDAEIDDQRFDKQDEYVEWHVERSADGVVTQVTFTTEFPEFWMALAGAGLDALQKSVAQLLPGAQPTAGQLFGSNFHPDDAHPEERAQRFRAHLRDNPWNNGDRGLLCLSQGSNTLSALFGLIGPCAKPDPDRPAFNVCDALNISTGGCVPGRNSDPFVCAAVQELARNGNGLTLDDPVGITIGAHQGAWSRGPAFFDINDPAQAGDVWSVARNGRRAVLKTPGLLLEDEPIHSGAQIARQLTVGARILWAPEGALPAWARANNESSRIIA